MSVILNKYEDRIDKCWYDSSNVLFSKCNDKKDDFKDLEIVFKDGRTYLYRDINVNDYILFKTDISQGKALYKYILKKYKGIRLTDTDLEKLNSEKEELMSSKTVDSDENKGDTIYHVACFEDHVELYQKDDMIYSSPKDKIDIIEVLRVIGIKCSSENKISGSN